MGQRSLPGAALFHALNLIDVGSHLVGNEILTDIRHPLVAQAMAQIWSGRGLIGPDVPCRLDPQRVRAVLR